METEKVIDGLKQLRGHCGFIYGVMIDEAIKYLATYDQIKWEHDIAIEQLKQLGYSLGEQPREHYWIKYRGEVKCPVCGLYDACVSNYCRNCGTKMEGIRKE